MGWAEVIVTEQGLREKMKQNNGIEGIKRNLHQNHNMGSKGRSRTLTKNNYS